MFHCVIMQSQGNVLTCGSKGSYAIMMKYIFMHFSDLWNFPANLPIYDKIVRMPLKSNRPRRICVTAKTESSKSLVKQACKNRLTLYSD